MPASSSFLYMIYEKYKVRVCISNGHDLLLVLLTRCFGSHLYYMRTFYFSDILDFIILTFECKETDVLLMTENYRE